MFNGVNRSQDLWVMKSENSVHVLRAVVMMSNNSCYGWHSSEVYEIACTQNPAVTYFFSIFFLCRSFYIVTFNIEKGVKTFSEPSSLYFPTAWFRFSSKTTANICLRLGVDSRKNNGSVPVRHWNSLAPQGGAHGSILHYILLRFKITFPWRLKKHCSPRD